MANWIGINSKWQSKIKTDGPSLKLWWFVYDSNQKKRWVVKNLKAFVDKHFNDHIAYFSKRTFYEELSKHGHVWPHWGAFKPETHDELYNILGTSNLKIFKGAFEEEIPFDAKEFRKLKETGYMNSKIENFWNDIEFTL